jgi:broad specificity phosphatase PhoE
MPDLKELGIAFQMPRRLALLRHGESQANLINRAIKKKIISEFPPQYLATPDREIRLSRKGQAQAAVTGKWLAEQYPDGFDAIFVSNHARAMETASLACAAAGWKNVRILIDPLLGERNWGVFSTRSPERREELMDLRERDPLHMPMPDGETLLMTRLRSRTLLERCSREFSGKRVLVVTHGEYIEALWSEVAHFSTETQRDFFNSEKGDLRNCQVVEFAGEDPSTGKWEGKLRWVRSSCPQANSFPDWSPIERTKFSPEELMEHVKRYPRLDLTSFGDPA